MSTYFGFSRAQFGAFVLLVGFIAVGPSVLYPVFLMKLLCYALFACAFNLLIGYAGLLSLGHAAYFGMGGYIAGYMAKQAGLSPELAVLAGGAVAAGMGTVFGWLAIRRQGIYFAMITLALAQIVYFFCVDIPFTHGEDGIQAIPRGDLFGVLPLHSDKAMYIFTAVVFLALFLLLHRVVHSPFGQVLKAIRENEPRAISLGYRADAYKLMAFILSTTIAGVAGGTKALVFGFATLSDVHYSMSGEVVLMTLIGGMGTIFGPVLGAAIVVTMENYLASYGSWVSVIQGTVFVAAVLLFRRGLVGELAAKLKISL